MTMKHASGSLAAVFGIAAAFTLATALPALAAGNHQGHEGVGHHGDGHQHGEAHAHGHGDANPRGTGTVRIVDHDRQRVVLHHEPMPQIDWPAMVMPFPVSDPGLLQGLEEGQAVEFTLREMEQAGKYEIVEIAPVQ